MACHPPIGKVKGHCRGKKANQKEKDSRVPVLPDEVEESFSIRQGSMILPFLERLAPGGSTSEGVTSDLSIR